MFRVFGFTGAVDAAAGAEVVLGVDVSEEAAPDAGAFAAPVVEFDPAALLEVPLDGVVVVAGVVGKVVNGVGSGGYGFDITVAIISGKPASDLLRYLYQVVRLSIQIFLAAALAASVPESDTARAYASIIRSIT